MNTQRGNIMLTNFHTHSTFCDGKNTPEEVVLKAIEKGFAAIGFSGHGYTPYDLRYCMKDTDAYITEVNRLKKAYQGKIQVYLGVEEDAFSILDRSKFDYIIGSCHYMHIGNQYFPVDSGYEYFKKCLDAYDYDVVRLSEDYYRPFCDYINKRKPDIIGHFDLITKFDEQNTPLFLCNAQYHKIAETYIAEALKNGCIFELNTGAIARGLRTTPYPNENLLYILKKADAKLILSSDSHRTDTLDFGFEDAKNYLRGIGFRHLYTLFDHAFQKYDI